jgi:hypothetical protein
MENCSLCRYYNSSAPASGEGECRRYPPSITSARVSLAADFPPVSDYEWCGEFRKKDDGKPITITA